MVAMGGCYGWMLIGACNPTLCPHWGFRESAQKWLITNDNLGVPFDMSSTSSQSMYNDFAIIVGVPQRG